MKKQTLLEFWNENTDKINHVFWASVGSPTGYNYYENLNEDAEEDYCDLNDVLENICCPDEYNNNPIWELEGEVTEDGWEWDGSGNPTDFNRNNLTLLRVYYA